MSILSDELTNDPLGRGYAVMTDAQVSADLLTEYRTYIVELSKSDILRWGFGREGLANLRDAADKTGAYTGISQVNRAKAIAAYVAITDLGSGFDLNDAELMALVDELISTGFFVAQDKTDLLTRATKPISRGDELGVETDPFYIAEARA